MKQTVFICIIVAIVFLAIGRLTAPKTHADRMQEIDSLKRDIKAREAFKKLAVDSMAKLEKWGANQKERGDSLQNLKTATKIVYVKEVARINSLTTAQLDSAIRARYPD